MEVIIGLLMPLLVDLAAKYLANSKVRFWAAVVLCLAVSGAKAAIEGTIPGPDFFTDFGIIFSMSQVMYKQFWAESVPREAYLNFIGDTARALKIKNLRLNP